MLSRGAAPCGMASMPHRSPPAGMRSCWTNAGRSLSVGCTLRSRTFVFSSHALIMATE